MEWKQPIRSWIHTFGAICRGTFAAVRDLNAHLLRRTKHLVFFPALRYLLMLKSYRKGKVKMLVHETLVQDRLSTRVSVSLLDRRVCKRAYIQIAIHIVML